MLGRGWMEREMEIEKSRGGGESVRWAINNKYRIRVAELLLAPPSAHNPHLSSTVSFLVSAAQDFS